MTSSTSRCFVSESAPLGTACKVTGSQDDAPLRSSQEPPVHIGMFEEIPTSIQFFQRIENCIQCSEMGRCKTHFNDCNGYDDDDISVLTITTWVAGIHCKKDDNDDNDDNDMDSFSQINLEFINKNDFDAATLQTISMNDDMAAHNSSTFSISSPRVPNEVHTEPLQISSSTLCDSPLSFDRRVSQTMSTTTFTDTDDLPQMSLLQADFDHVVTCSLTPSIQSLSQSIQEEEGVFVHCPIPVTPFNDPFSYMTLTSSPSPKYTFSMDRKRKQISPLYADRQKHYTCTTWEIDESIVSFFAIPDNKQ